jgi:hypothetical protein
MSFGGTVLNAIQMNRANLAKLRSRKHFSKDFNKYTKPRNVLNLKKPSNEEILLNRKEVENYRKRRMAINLLFIAFGIAIIAMMMLQLS